MSDYIQKELNGIIVVDKEKGMTSHDVVNLVRKNFKIKKVGHAGTLDPNATGVLILLLGKATKLSAKYLNDEKEYLAEMKLGERTDSGDAQGKIIEKYEVNVSEIQIRKVVESFLGESLQIPPMVSAKKVKGKRLYKLARKGIEIEREPKKIFIKSIEILEINLPIVVFKTVCSKGTYIRQLAEDIGAKLACSAHLTELRRLRSGEMTLEKAISVKSLLDSDQEDLRESISWI